jgi:hypothetical protein
MYHVLPVPLELHTFDCGYSIRVPTNGFRPRAKDERLCFSTTGVIQTAAVLIQTEHLKGINLKATQQFFVCNLTRMPNSGALGKGK